MAIYCQIVVSVRFMIEDMESTEFIATGRIYLLQSAKLSEYDAFWKVMPFILIDVCTI